MQGIMTVRELREKLEGLPDDMGVYIMIGTNVGTIDEPDGDDYRRHQVVAVHTGWEDALGKFVSIETFRNQYALG